MSDFIGLEVKGLEELQAKLAKLPDQARNDIVDDVNKDVLNYMKAYEPYKHVSLKQAYGGFVSDKQRRFFFAALEDGRITVPYKRTQALSNAWTVIGKGYQSIIANQQPYAGYVMGDNEQANMMRLEGWKPISKRLKEHMAAIIKTADAAVKKAIKKLNLD
jgi:hypothetical protein